MHLLAFPLNLSCHWVVFLDLVMLIDICMSFGVFISLVHRYAVNRAHRYRESVFGSVF